jgi:hypothetical protein
MQPLSSFALFAFLLGVGSLEAADAKLTAKLEKVGPPAEIKEPIRALLGDDAIRVQDEKGGTVCTLWFRKEIPSKATPEQVKNGITYREIAATTIIGAIQLPQKWIDFRKQEIPKGVYTLRLAIQPMDGDHMGTAPHNEFCLLCPADKDVKAETMEVKAMHELSASAHGATHPAVLLLFPTSKPADEPNLLSKGGGIWVLQVKRPIVAGSGKTTLGFGMTVAGHTTE